MRLFIIILIGLISFSAIGQNPIQAKKVERLETKTETPLSIQSRWGGLLFDPDSVYIKGRKYEFYDSTLKLSHKAVGGNFFLGYGIYNGNISEYFSNPYFFGLNIEFYRKNLAIQIDDYIGFGKTTQTLSFPEQKEWKENKTTLSFMIGANLGYSIIDNKNIKLVPLAGINGTILSSTFLTTSDNSSNEPFLPYYKIGFYIDIKPLALGQYVKLNGSDVSYNTFRLSFGLNSSIGNPKYPEYYKGNMFYITIGVGGLARDISKK